MDFVPSLFINSISISIESSSCPPLTRARQSGQRSSRDGMAPVLLDLGSLELVSTTSGVQLQLTSQALVAPFAEDRLDPNLLTIQSLIASHRERPWVSRGNRFHLALEIHVASDIELSARDEIMQNLVSSMRQARASQLGLHVSAWVADVHYSSGTNLD